MTGRSLLTRILTFLVTTATVVPLAACTDTSPRASAPSPHPAPTGFADCNDLAPRRSDGFVVVGSDWSSEPHAFGAEATMYACVYPPTGGVVRLLVSGRAIYVEPRRQRVSDFPGGVVPFRVTVDAGGGGVLTVRQDLAGGGYSGGPGPTVEAGDDGWRFTRPDD